MDRTGRLRFYYPAIEAPPVPHGHRFPAAKYRMLRDLVAREGIFPPDALHASPLASVDELLRAHSPAYVEAVLNGTLAPEIVNALDGDVMALIGKAIPLVQEKYKALVVYNEGSNFSAGANIKMILEAIQTKKWSDIDKLLREFQGALQMIKFAPFPSISCPYGLTLGGGCEVALHGDRIQAAAETYMGLPEVGVGLIPGAQGLDHIEIEGANHFIQEDAPERLVEIIDTFVRTDAT